MLKFYREYGISQSSLEEVFLAITKKHEFKYEDELETFSVNEMEENVETNTPSSHDSTTKITERKTYPYRALIWYCKCTWIWSLSLNQEKYCNSKETKVHQFLSNCHSSAGYVTYASITGIFDSIFQHEFQLFLDHHKKSVWRSNKREKTGSNASISTECRSTRYHMARI